MARNPSAILVVDTETTVDAAQALIVGGYRYYRVSWEHDVPRLCLLSEGLFHRDSLDVADPAAHRIICEYAAQTAVPVDADAPDAQRSRRVLSREAFVRQVLVRACSGGATVVGFNLPFDLARVAVGWSVARAERFEGGFSLPLGSYTDPQGVRREDTAVPRVLGRSLDTGRTRMGFGSVRPGSDPYAVVRRKGALLDLHTLARALSDGKSRTLEAACAEFGVNYEKRDVKYGRLTPELLEYLRDDLDATARLYVALATEYERWHLHLAPTRAYSAASLAKALLRETGIEPALKRQPSLAPERLGQAMSAYYGGRAEVRVRAYPVPVVTVDVRSMHATVAVLQRLSRFLSCDRIRFIDEPPRRVAEWQRLLEQMTVERCLQPEFWRQLNGFALVEPDGAVLPVRARYSARGSYAIGVNPLDCDTPMWVTLADLCAAALLGPPPTVLEVFRIEPTGRARGLRPIRVRDADRINPYTQDVYKLLVEQRRTLEARGDQESLRTAAALKVTANSLSYGIWAELNRREPQARPVEVPVWGLAEFTAQVVAPEDLGEYFLGPLASLIPGGARLMLALLERLVTDQGGTYATCDTDGMAIIATQTGGLIPCPGGNHKDDHRRECVHALTWQQIDQIIERLAVLNPYDPHISPGSVLRYDPENYTDHGDRRQLWCYAVSAKRYLLHTRTPEGDLDEIVKASEHALGGIYLNPTDPDSDSDDKAWVKDAWRWILARDGHARLDVEPVWLDRPALTRFVATHPRLLAPFAEHNADEPYSHQVKPYGFLLVAHAQPGGLPPGADPARFALVAPYETDPTKWPQLPWRNVYDPDSPAYQLDTTTVFNRGGYAPPPGTVDVLTYRAVLERHRRRPESKSATPAGPCRRHTVGLLARRPVSSGRPVHIGKEANLLDQIASGLVTDETETTTIYEDPAVAEWENEYLPVLRTLNVRDTAAALGVNPATITRLRRRGVTPRRRLRAAVKELIDGLGDERG